MKDTSAIPGAAGLLEPVMALAEEIAVRLPQPRPGLAFVVREKGVDVLPETGAEEALVSVAGRPSEALKAVLAQMDIRLPPLVSLTLSPGQAVTKELRLPAQSDEILEAIVRNKVEAVAPWPIANSSWGHRVRRIPGDAQHVLVDLAVVSRSQVAGLTAILGEAGTAVSSVGIALNDGGAINLGFGSERRSGKARRLMAGGIIGMASIAACAGAVGAFLLFNAERELAGLQRQSESLMASIRAADPELGGSIVAEANRLRRERLNAAPRVAVLNDLSAALPSTVWLTSLWVEGDKVEVKGQGSDIPSLIETLEKSPAFSDVNFASATQKSASREADEFSLRATLEPMQTPAGGAP